jgi:hypothetical protein
LFWRSVAPAQMQTAKIHRHISKDCLRMLILFLQETQRILSRGTLHSGRVGRFAF